MEITLEEIQKKFESLPEDLKWAIMAANVDDNIIEIGQTQNLNVEQMGQLSLETHMVMFGFTHPDKFEESVKNSMKLGDEKTRAVVNAVNEKILKEIRTKMMALYDKTPAVSEAPTEEENNIQILNSAGIEILNGKTPPATIQPKEKLPIMEKLELPIKPTILAQKLSGPVQTPVVKTEHTLENITKNSDTTTPPQSNSKKYEIDPYREKPE